MRHPGFGASHLRCYEDPASHISAKGRILDKVGLGQGLMGSGDNDMGRVLRALHGEFFPGIC